MKFASLITILFFSTHSFGACTDYFKIYGLLNLKNKKWTTLKIDNKPRSICEKLPEIPNANIQLSFKKDSNNWTTKIYRSLDGYWDHPEKDGTFTGGSLPLTEIEINSFIPTWYSGSVLTIQETPSNKKLTETKL